MFRKSLLAHMLSLSIGAAALAFAADASAKNTLKHASGYISQLEYNFNGGLPFMYLQLNGDTSTNYEAPTFAPSCGSPALNLIDSDTMRYWVGMAQAALLSGSNVTVVYVQCSGAGPSALWITDIKVQ